MERPGDSPHVVMSQLPAHEREVTNIQVKIGDSIRQTINKGAMIYEHKITRYSI